MKMKCDCNKNRCLMNDVIWTRHLNACPVRKATTKKSNYQEFFYFTSIQKNM